jgi:hypothetical protein
MEQKNDVLGILALVLVVAMLAQFGVDYLRSHGRHHTLFGHYIIE